MPLRNRLQGRDSQSLCGQHCDRCRKSPARPCDSCELILCAACEAEHAPHCAYGKFEPSAIPARVEPAAEKKEIA